MSEKSDGRRARGHANRRRIVEALLDLVGAGNISPSAEEVSEKAKVGLRTVFRHFDDMDGLYREVSDRMIAEIAPIVSAPLPEGGWPHKLEALVERRARVFEKMMPFKSAADVHRHRSAFLRDEHEALTRMQRSTLQAALPSALAKDRLRLEALDLLLSFDTWRRLRQEQGLSVALAKKTVFAAASSLGSGEME